MRNERFYELDPTNGINVVLVGRHEFRNGIVCAERAVGGRSKFSCTEGFLQTWGVEVRIAKPETNINDIGFTALQAKKCNLGGGFISWKRLLNPGFQVGFLRGVVKRTEFACRSIDRTAPLGSGLGHGKNIKPRCVGRTRKGEIYPIRRANLAPIHCDLRTVSIGNDGIAIHSNNDRIKIYILDETGSSDCLGSCGVADSNNTNYADGDIRFRFFDNMLDMMQTDSLGGVTWNVSNKDIDISNDGIHWYHLLGWLCKEHLQRIKIMPHETDSDSLINHKTIKGGW